MNEMNPREIHEMKLESNRKLIAQKGLDSA